VVRGGQQAIVVRTACIVAVDGPATQTEGYTLRRIDSYWLIGNLGITDQV
jgi:hypothetical protein